LLPPEIGEQFQLQPQLWVGTEQVGQLLVFFRGCFAGQFEAGQKPESFFHMVIDTYPGRDVPTGDEKKPTPFGVG
jgi:hypothetical protein